VRIELAPQFAVGADATSDHQLLRPLTFTARSALLTSTSTIASWKPRQCPPAADR
jgi:hypothetical protein